MTICDDCGGRVHERGHACTAVDLARQQVRLLKEIRDALVEYQKEEK